MGKPKIILRPTSMLSKTSGQIKKLFGMWDKKPTVHKDYRLSFNNKNPQPTISQGRPDFLNNTKFLDTRFITRRQIVLNRHFTEIVSDVLLVNLDQQLNELGVEITSIETKAWNKGLRIFYSTSKPFDRELHDKLGLIIVKLSAAITERRLIGRTPQIDFVYDKDAELDQNINAALANKVPPPLEHETGLERVSMDQLEQIRNKKTPNKKVTLNPRAFSAPDDMTNMTLGLDYPVLYNQVISKLARGRGESSRMISATEIASQSKPLFKAPMGEEEKVDDARERVMQMQRFLVSQKKKNQYMSRLRRKNELLKRDTYKWDMPRDGEDAEDGYHLKDYENDV